FGNNPSAYDREWPYDLTTVFKSAGYSGEEALNALYRAYGYNVDKAVKSQAGKYVNKVYQFGGYSTEGYKEDSPDRDNDYNVIPSNVITMEGVRKALRAIPISNGIPLGEIEMQPGKKYVFPEADEVLEIPKMQYGTAPPDGGALLYKTYGRVKDDTLKRKIGRIESNIMDQYSSRADNLMQQMNINNDG